MRGFFVSGMRVSIGAALAASFLIDPDGRIESSRLGKHRSLRAVYPVALQGHAGPGIP